MNSTGRFFASLLFLAACAILPLSAEARTAAAGADGRLIVQRVANFGTNLSVHLWIDGIKVATISLNHTYEGPISPGHHVLSVLSSPNVERRQPTSVSLNVQPGQTCVFTAFWHADRGAVLRRVGTPNDAPRVP